MFHQHYINTCINAKRILIIFAVRNPQDSHNRMPISFLRTHLSTTMWPWAQSNTSSKYPRWLYEVLYQNFTCFSAVPLCSNSHSCPKIPLTCAGLCFHDHTLMMKEAFLSSIAQHALLCHWCTGSLSWQYFNSIWHKVLGSILGMKGVTYSILLYYFNSHIDALPPDTLSVDQHQQHRDCQCPCSLPDIGIMGRMLPTLSM